MCLTIIAITNYDSRFLVVPLISKDMIVGTDPTQVALMDEVIIQDIVDDVFLHILFTK